MDKDEKYWGPLTPALSLKGRGSLGATGVVFLLIHGAAFQFSG